MNCHTLLNIDSGFIQENGLATVGDINEAIDAHKLESDPHPQYALDSDVTNAITDHEAKLDPHPQYLTAAEGLSNPMTASGDIIYGSTGGVPARLAKSTDGKVLKLVGGLPAWADESGGGGGGISEAPLDGNTYGRESGGWTILGVAAKRGADGTGNLIASSIAVSKDSATGAANIPFGTVAQRPTVPAKGMFRFNDDSDKFEGYNGTAWGSVGGGATGGGTDEVFYQNGNTVNSDYTVTKNEMSAGPIAIADTKKVTIADGARWVIV